RRGHGLGKGEANQKEDIERSLLAPMSPSPKDQSPPAINVGAVVAAVGVDVVDHLRRFSIVTFHGSLVLSADIVRLRF
ncbi:hypothetical protein U1Q18_008650, partial [Sarracenia purpurea var. burkii]